MSIPVLLLCVFAFACLAMAMDRHQETVFGKALSGAASRGFRSGGWCGLVVALWLIVAARGWAMGLVCYSGMTSLAAGVVYCAVVSYERRLAGR